MAQRHTKRSSLSKSKWPVKYRPFFYKEIIMFDRLFKKLNKGVVTVGNNNHGNISGNNNVIINGKAHTNISSNHPHVIGNGIENIIELTTQPFDSIHLLGSIDVDFIASEESKIKIQADENIMALIDIRYKANTLEIGFKPNTSFISHNPIIVLVSHPYLTHLELRGSGNISISRLQEERFTAVLKGSGNISLQGESKTVELLLSGSGDIEASKLIASNLDATISGSGDIKAFANTSVRANLKGSGDIIVHGRPSTQERSCSGSGSINIL